LTVVRFDVEVVCRAVAIPEELVIDLTEFKIGDNISSANIDLKDGVEFAISDRDFAIAAIAAPKTAEEEAEDEEGTEGEEGEAAEGETAEGDAAEGDDE
jgi:large subunit ribosomal protein L25